MNNSQSDPVVVITGGTGSFGSAFARFLLRDTQARIRIISRDEHKQEALKAELKTPRATFILCDVRDAGRLRIACAGADLLVHAAALKTVPAGEIHAAEFAKTNIVGTLNVIEAVLSAGIPQSLLISSDKAVDAFNAYGKTKAVAESIWVQANQWGVCDALKFAAVRGGNVWGSNGSVMEIWRKQIERGETIVVHEPDITRFHLPLNAWVRFCWRALTCMHGGEIFVPVLPAWRLGDLAQAFGGPVQVAEQRDGDKDAEVLISPHEVRQVKDIGWAYAIEPNETLRGVTSYDPYPERDVPEGFEYNSRRSKRLTVQELREWIAVSS